MYTQQVTDASVLRCSQPFSRGDSPHKPQERWPSKISTRTSSLSLPSSLSSKTIVFSVICAVLLTFIFPASAKSQNFDDASYSYYYNYNNGMGEYLSDWNQQEWAKMSGRIQQPKCIDIPSNLTLCHGIGYTEMMLPNLLDHDTLTEVTQQAASWVPLIRINCHPDTKVFLCSLFSPVCLERLIYPCRSLCMGVQASCQGRMKTYGFGWPEMLKCDKFPMDNDMCIKLIHDVKPDNKCTACKHPHTKEALIDNFCHSKVVMRVTLKDLQDVNGHKELVLRRKKKLFKHENITKRDTRQLRVFIKNGANCQCETVNSTKERYLIMGNPSDGKLFVDFGMVWNRKDREFKKGLRAIRKGASCEGIFREMTNDVDGKKKGKGRKNRKRKGKKGRKGRKGKKRKKGRKGRKGKKNKSKDEKDNKGEPSPNDVNRGGGVSKSDLEDQALNNFKKAAN